MQWLELTIDAPQGEVELVAARLVELGIEGLVIEDEADFLSFLEENRKYWDYVDDELHSSMSGKSRVTFYLEDTPEGGEQLAFLKKQLDWPVAVNRIREEDWANNWKKYYMPIPVGERLVVIPQWLDVDHGERIPLRLDPGLIFGTGAHPTTKLCLEAVERFARPGQQVLDLGCGSGILGIAAVLLGAGHVTGCDIDPKAPAVVAENARLNGLDESKITPLWGDVLSQGSFRQKLSAQEYDLILANIVADVIIGLSSFTALWLKPDGKMICSGIICGREDEVERALKDGGFAVLEQHRDGDWHSFVCAKKH